jgi:hypothetical protein
LAQAARLPADMAAAWLLEHQQRRQLQQHQHQRLQDLQQLWQPYVRCVLLALGRGGDAYGVLSSAAVRARLAGSCCSAPLCGCQVYTLFASSAVRWICSRLQLQPCMVNMLPAGTTAKMLP